MKRVLALTAVVLGALALAGCGDTEAEKAAPTASTMRTVTELTGFTSDDLNIGCYIDTDSVRCDIDERDWRAPAKPADCQLDFGQGIQMVTGQKAQFVCAGDTALRGGKPLASGHSIHSGTITCTNDRDTVTCRDQKSKHGFRLNDEAYRLF